MNKVVDSPEAALADIQDGATVAIAGMTILLARHAARPFELGAVALALAPVSYLPNLVVADTWPPFRTQGALASLVALYVGLGLLGLWLAATDFLRHPGRRPVLIQLQRIATTTALVLACISMAVAGRTTDRLIVTPQVDELRLLRTQVEALPWGAPQIAFVMTPWAGGPTTEHASDEFGLPSSARPWALQPSVYLILREVGRIDMSQPRPAILAYPPETVALPNGVPTIDLRAALSMIRDTR